MNFIHSQRKPQHAMKSSVRLSAPEMPAGATLVILLKVSKIKDRKQRKCF